MLDGTGDRLLREGFLPVVLVPVGQALGLDRPEKFDVLVAGQLAGLILMRYLLEVEPLASTRPASGRRPGSISHAGSVAPAARPGGSARVGADARLDLADRKRDRRARGRGEGDDAAP